ncbi:uncharacterized protein LOC131328676 [Rhododendron vialii]|uniref:uncharacterized protein LOC131328676 n=1 Tax=Rhododendron vialii TaxID=182163 RepID=UPI00265F976F|nr:uncharacterized protein LOC131328676 [Rhododendron vialii]
MGAFNNCDTVSIHEVSRKPGRRRFSLSHQNIDPPKVRKIISNRSSPSFSLSVCLHVVSHHTFSHKRLSILCELILASDFRTTLPENSLKEIEGGVILESQAALVASRKSLTKRKVVLNITHEILERWEARLRAAGQLTVCRICLYVMVAVSFTLIVSL